MSVFSLPGYKPLCFVDQKLYLYRKGFIYVLADRQPEKLLRVYHATWKEWTRISSRLFRCEPKYAVPIGPHSMLLVGHRKMMLVDVQNKKSTELERSRKAFSDPLNVCSTQGRWSALWGDYGSNPEHMAINIYGLTQDNKVEHIFSFYPGQIRHIHNIIARQSGGYYILAGDCESGAGIYKADEYFNQVEPVKTGKQQYRAVVAFDTPNGLLYATDAVNEQNYIYLLRGDAEPERIAPLNGSCIYGTEYKGCYYFSTTVEPDEKKQGLASWISKKRGKGILSDEVFLIKVDAEMRVSETARYKKDWWPMKLLQYGAIQFPKGNSEKLWIYPVAVKRLDGIAVEME